MRNLPVGCFAGVTSRMVVQMLFARKALTTDCTIVRFVGGVSLHMAIQRRCVRKNMKADCASEHGSTQVTLAVTRQIVCVRECFTAYLKSSIRNLISICTSAFCIDCLLHAKVQRFPYLTRKRLPLGMISAMHDKLITKLKDLSAYLASVTANWYGRCTWTGSCLAIARLYVKFVQWDLLHDWSTILYRGNCLRGNSATH